MALKLADMKRSASDKKAERKRWDSPAAADGDDYHHGLHIELDHPAMQKVGMDDMPASGDEYHGEFHGRVVDTHEDSSEGQEPRRRVRVLVHHLGMKPKGNDADGDNDRPRAGLRSSIEKAAKDADDKR